MIVTWAERSLVNAAALHGTAGSMLAIHLHHQASVRPSMKR
jgi:hypothetical protein